MTVVSLKINGYFCHNTVQYNNGIYTALFAKRSGALTQLAVIRSAK